MKIADGSFRVKVKNLPITIGYIAIMPKLPILVDCYYVVRKEIITGYPKYYCEGGEIAFYLMDTKTGSADLIGIREFQGEKVGIKEVDLELNARVLEVINKQVIEQEKERNFMKKVKQEIKEILK